VHSVVDELVKIIPNKDCLLIISRNQKTYKILIFLKHGAEEMSG